MKEIWKDIPNYEGLYQISSFGRIKSFYGRKDILKLYADKDGYYRVALTKNKKTKHFGVNRLVAQTFIGYEENKQANHKNGIKTDNRVENIEWLSCRENILHSIYTLKKRFKKVVKIDRKTHKEIEVYESIVEAGTKNNIKPQNIWRCANKIRKIAGNYIWEYKEGE